MGAHWETRRGSHQQALTYVTKAESRVSGPFKMVKPMKPVKGRVPISQTLSQLWKPTACKALFLDIPKPSSVMELDSCVCTFIENFSPVIGPDLSLLRSSSPMDPLDAVSPLFSSASSPRVLSPLS